MNQRTKLWIVAAVSFAGFVFALKPEITGFAIHEWLGIAVCGVLIVHVLMHWKWLLRVTKNFGKVKPSVKFNYVVDVSLGVGFFLILVTGLIISNLLGLYLTAFLFGIVRFVHVFSSFSTFVLLMVKIAKHMDWITKVTKNVFGLGQQRAASSAVVVASKNEAVTAKREAPANPARREALRMMLIGGAGSVLAGKWMLEWGENNLVQSSVAQAAEETILTVPATATNEAVESTILVSNVVLDPLLDGVRACRKGFQCEYPGRCHDYQDINGNNLCDLGEVLAFNLVQSDNSVMFENESDSGNGNQKRNGSGGGQSETFVSTATSAPTSVTTEIPTEAPVIVIQPTADVLVGVMACRKGKHCSYPGVCHDYQDINSNNLCDRGEVY